MESNVERITLVGILYYRVLIINIYVKAATFEMHALHWQQRIPTACLSIF